MTGTERAWAGARLRRVAWSVVGGFLAAALLAGSAEAFLRFFPPRDLHPYLGELSPLSGPYVPDDDFRVAYRSWEDFRSDNAERLAQFGPLGHESDSRPVWAMFGNSFVQAPGMLADTARTSVPERRIFNLGRNEPMVARLAQIKLLLEHGLEPERIIVVLLPIDGVAAVEQPPSAIHVTARGALTYRPRLPGGPGAAVITHSRLALTGWVRSGRHRGSADFRPERVNRGIPPPALADLRTLFGNLAWLAGRHNVPVTVILIPNYEQVMRGAPCGFQDALAPALREEGIDVLDPRAAFLRQPDRAALFLPDKHLTPAGNHLLLGELLDHLRAPELHAAAGLTRGDS
jgi:hypothetical protein